MNTKRTTKPHKPNSEFRIPNSELSRAKALPPKSPCEFSARCGGCSRVHIPYAEQLKMKQSAMEKLLSGICPVEPILGMDDPWHYRSKVHAVIGTDFKTKQPISGVYQRGTHRVVPVQGCLIEDERA
ncbi:MAG: 23S rRNA (uracil(1939)-C(5))-methyltransferase RlmD, partial [Clostridia bacterium]|nr:23S rRNA (uracil(1939)-C(5))-methyltransferase RlmD [Clostridia bacterium]